MGRTSIVDGQVLKSWQRQADATLSQANPVTATDYTVLDTALNCRVYGMAFRTGSTTAGTVSELKVTVTIDGNSIVYTKANPTANTWYYPKAGAELAAASQVLDTTDYMLVFNPLLEGRSVKVVVQVTWTVQPTPLEGRVKYGVLP